MDEETFERAVKKLIAKKWGREPETVEEVSRVQANRRTTFRAFDENYETFEVVLSDFEIDKVMREDKAA